VLYTEFPSVSTAHLLLNVPRLFSLGLLTIAALLSAAMVAVLFYALPPGLYLLVPAIAFLGTLAVAFSENVQRPPGQ
jgi:hypothetical protein